MNIKDSQSKLNEIKYEDFKIQPYLRSNDLTEEEKSILFRIRTRTVDDIKTNFRTKFNNDLMCRLCESETAEESQSHQLTCQSIIEECEELRKNKTVKYEDFFGHIESQVAATVLYKKVLETRTRLLKERENNDRQI